MRPDSRRRQRGDASSATGLLVAILRMETVREHRWRAVDGTGHVRGGLAGNNGCRVRGVAGCMSRLPRVLTERVSRPEVGDQQTGPGERCATGQVGGTRHICHRRACRSAPVRKGSGGTRQAQVCTPGPVLPFMTILRLRPALPARGRRVTPRLYLLGAGERVLR